ncbi:hypothetical protein C1645_830518 [Glomus cerebriforme]|uniref:hAT-like transposase RNase-H fold domain-containing protein n=1 Tax=Glomus cerebriforme TaxID=658196 RepID=A0A397SJ29_9GLOM|nr:hypothetical protein C1645_830518 [Glomus cerebriforme]
MLEVTMIISGSFYLTLLMIVPLYNILIDHVKDVINEDNNTDEEDDENNSNEKENWYQTIKETAKKCKVKLLEYYNKTNDIFLISTILDPRLKLKYYKDHN